MASSLSREEKSFNAYFVKMIMKLFLKDFCDFDLLKV